VEFEIGFDREEDGRWIAEVVGLPGVLASGVTREAEQRVGALAEAVLAERETEF
jgi:predicted RNase H-like HicB family nuclease